MATITERLSEDLPLAGITAAVEVANVSGGKIKPALADLTIQRNADRPRNPNTAINEDQHELLSDVYEIWQQVELSGGVIPATLLNMHPWRITATGPHNQGIVIPPCPIEDEFIQYVQRGPRFDFGDRWGKFKVRPVWPIQMMRDFQRQHFSWQGGEFPAGGIVVYMGDQLPGQAKAKMGGLYDKLFSVIKKIADIDQRKMLEEIIETERATRNRDAEEKASSNAEILEMIHDAREKQIAFYDKMYDWADQRWAEKTKAGYGSVTVMHRAVARWLLHRGRVTKAPPWVSEKKPKDFVQQLCAKCGANLSATGYACEKCGRISKPFLAYKDGAIAKDDPAMKRCSREELDSLGMTEVLTLEEQLVVDNQPEKKQKGKPKAE